MSASIKTSSVNFPPEISVNQSLFDTPKCPGIFYQTPARDGNIIRVRIPGGIINTLQLSAIIDLAKNFGDANVYLTNRANLQIRGVREIPSTAVTSLQQVGLAAVIPEIDHIRNIMASPTAGIDVEELINTLPLVRELDNYICSHPELQRLSAKFSVGFDGSGTVAIYQQPNDIKFVAVRDLDGEIYLRLLLGNSTNIVIHQQQCLPVIVALIKVYLMQVNIHTSSKPRFLEVVKNLGTEKYLELVKSELPFVLKRTNIQFDERENKHHHLDIHQQKQLNLSYIGIAINLGKISTSNLQKLGEIADVYGNKTLRLTPWQNILIPDIENQNIFKVKSEIANIGLQISASSPQSGIVACTGNQGCKAGITDTKAMATILAEYLTSRISLDLPCKIHLTSCSKSCAYHGKSDITLLGATIEKNGLRTEGYNLYIGDLETNFGREIYRNLPSTEISAVVLKILQIYQEKRQDLQETFVNFVNHYEIPTLQKLFNIDHLLTSIFKEVKD
ncbi:precorrin-3B synthase [Calothrix sp. PCC 6303]|uniref:precorrin-3B synthase n=1 Tax=Calothrix sp. PCC 6303 TaxID=1170562 RepID=UPI0002A008BB|nr:precorrin-3B synthase [Calothrix sp. PCC 6303]AFZ04234.1 assimilatory nitrite reductase (ferredoxin) precursor [Calothrix sp. PCC 6303]